MKKFISIILSISILLSTATVLKAEDSVDKITVTMNGEAMQFDAEPVVENNSVLIPMRAIFEALGCDVTYDETDGKKNITATNAENQITLEIGSDKMYVNGEEKELIAPAKIFSGRTLVPVRAISEALGADVNWSAETKTITITPKQVETSDEANPTDNVLDDSDVSKQGGNFTDEMKMPITYDFNDSGANAANRKGDHKNSPYFSNVDFYNAKSSDGLYILPQFKTIQQTSWWSCGVSSTEMVLNYYGKLGDWNEKTLADLRTDHSEIHKGTCLDQIIEMFEKVGGFKLETTYDYKDNLDAINLAFIKQHIKDGIPIIVGWNDWGGHWQVIIGYDDMGTEYEGDDVIIVADSFDTTDHNQDGYGVYGAERFIYNFTFFDFFNDEGHLKDKCFVAAIPE